jgi:tetraprenyl-beta-curcumene synthase
MNGYQSTLRHERPAVARGARGLSVGVLAAVTAAAGRELCWGLRGVSRELDHWKGLAERIPDPALRADAVGSLEDKRYYTDGAGLFWILPRRRSPELLALLVAYQTIANYLDYASERGVGHRGAPAGGLMLALVDAVDVDGPLRDYYADHPWSGDGGYLASLVTRCRTACAALPRYDSARPLLLREARRGVALELCHDPDGRRRDAALHAFARREFPPTDDVSWYEQAGSATSLLGVIVLLALAAEPDGAERELQDVADVYIPWAGALSLMLDSYVDQDDDARTGAWSAVAWYGDPDAARERLAALTGRVLRDVARLPRGNRHVVIVSTMLAMYLTSDRAAAGSMAGPTRELLRAGGPLVRGLAPVLRGWRRFYGQRE